jgi:hypothetical protein
MRKTKFLFSLSLIYLLIFPLIIYAADETLTITTYYPSPYGSYNNLTVANTLGVGTTSPSAKLTAVAGSDTWSGDFLGLSTSNKVRLGTYGGVATVAANNNAGDAWANLLINPGGGNVGIGTAAPAYILDVNGPLQYRANGIPVVMSNVYAAYFEYVAGGSAWGVTKWASSKRFKENITGLEIDSSKIYDLNLVSFNWKPDRGGQRDFGIIAEEAAKILPLLVAYDKEGKPFSVRYDLLSVLLLNELKKIKADQQTLIEALKKQQKEIEGLRQEIQKLKRKHDRNG